MQFHPQGHTCKCNAPLKLVTSGPAAKNPGRQFYTCQYNDRNDPNAGCDMKFCWVEEYPAGFNKPKFGGGGGGQKRKWTPKTTTGGPVTPTPFVNAGNAAQWQGSNTATGAAYAAPFTAPAPSALPNPKEFQEVKQAILNLQNHVNNRFDMMEDILRNHANDMASVIGQFIENSAMEPEEQDA